MKGKRPTRTQLLLALSTMAKTNMNTGLRTKKGKVIYQGPRGGRFTRSKSGKKVYKV